MMLHRRPWRLGLGALAFALIWGAASWGVMAWVVEPMGHAELRAAAKKLYDAGNYNDAYGLYRRLLAEPGHDPLQIGTDQKLAIDCLNSLGRINEADALLEQTVQAHADEWRVLLSAAQNYLRIDHSGYIIAGKFTRGGHRGGGDYFGSLERDRARALQLCAQALPLADKEDEQRATAELYFTLAQVLMRNGYGDAWRLQALTALDKLPDYTPGYWWGQESRGAPVDAQGNPIYYRVPKSWEKSASDGERWRWALAQASQANPGRTDEAQWQFIQFCQSQFGVETLAQYGAWLSNGAGAEPGQSGTFELHTLGEDETIARLATGVRRFKLPDEFNPIRLCQQTAQVESLLYRLYALDQLAQIFENRRQYPRAAEYWKQGIALQDTENRREEFAQITNNWGRFEGGQVLPAGRGAELDFRFRNARNVEFRAREIKVADLLHGVKEYIKSRPREVDHNLLEIDNIGYRLVEGGASKYLGPEVARWSLKLEPREHHFDRRITVTTPLEKAGAYYITAQVEGGNASNIVVWLEDTVIIKKPLEAKTLYYVADAVTGRPLEKVNLELFGFRVRGLGNNQYTIDIADSAEFTDADGRALQSLRRYEQNGSYQWLITARGGERLAHLGFTHIWTAQYDRSKFDQVKVFAITDRPVYRPAQNVEFKLWATRARYGDDEPEKNNSPYAGQTVTVEIHDPQGNKVHTQSIQADKFGGVAGTYELPSDAKLGVYQVHIPSLGGGSFRVEEYKKPEFEVKIDAPAEPVVLGEKIKAQITARYYFGAPVTEATVKYKVLRSPREQTWFPIGRWDWLYGRGYWWFAYDYDWYPGFRSWGCVRPWMPWWPRHHAQPEVVAEAEAAIGADGTVAIEIDTALAKQLHGDEDHAYSITAEVTDQSRRTIVGSGEVLAAREPFKIFTWLDRGHYRVGDTVEASFQAQTLDEKPIMGQGRLRLLKITYDEARKPAETEVQAWDLNTNAEGRAEQTLTAAAPGQYRLSYKLRDAKDHEIEGGYVFTVIGEGFDAAQYRFAHLELAPDQREYAPGDKLRLQINTDRPGSSVLLFLRPRDGVYLMPRLVRLSGQSTVVELDVKAADMPNFFVEAVTVADGRVYTETKDIVVPPEKRVLNVKVEPTKDTYRPGEKAEVKLTVTGIDGKPVVGSLVLAMYDKALEYISDGSNVPEIREFFWKWRRTHYPRTENNLERWFSNMVGRGQKAMNNLGLFGGSVADELPERDGAERLSFGGVGGGGEGYSGQVRLGVAAAAMAPAAPAPANGMSELSKATADKQEGEAGGAPLVVPTIRTNFADTALWVAALETDGDGVATVSLTMPENLSTWKARAWGMGEGTRVGEGTVEVITTKDLLVRLQAPRFFVETDEVVLSANVHNYLKTAKQVQVVLELDGGVLQALGDSTQTVEAPAGGEARVDWRVRVMKEGEAVVRMKALTDEESDAMEMRFPAFVHGMLKTESLAGAMRPEHETATFTFVIPEQRRPELSRFELRYSPSLAAAMVDALPYLAEYPYGCTEQTLNRFLPTVITQKILREMNLDLKAIGEKRVNLNAQEIGPAEARAERWKRFEHNPVFEPAEVDRMVKDGVRKLTEMQCSDGGWGWFSGYGEHSYPHTTAVVVHGLQVAAQNDVALVPGVLENGVQWLQRYQANQVELIQNFPNPNKDLPRKQHADDLDAYVYMVLADAQLSNDEMRAFLNRDRTELSVYAKALLALALDKQGHAAERDDAMRNIAQYLEQDDENQTAWLRLPQEGWWHWHGNDVEAMAYYLKLLAQVEPQGEVASRLVKYLLNNRKHATYWNSTRDTALCIESLADYLRATGQAQPNLELEVLVDGEPLKRVKITPTDLFTFDGTLVLEGDALAAGKHTVELRKRGDAPLYYNAYTTNFTKQDFIDAAGLEIKVERKFYQLIPLDEKELVSGSRGQALEQKVEKFRRAEIPSLATLASGELVEIELKIDSKNDYEYLLFEDMKAAGFEAVEQQSGYNGNALGAYVEYRDNRVAFFVRQLARGEHSVKYRLRAEIPGKFSALPTRGSAMYAPELRANSAEMKISIAD